MFLGVPYRFLRAAVFGILVCFVLAPVAALPYRTDDSINRNWPLRPLGDQFGEVMDLVVAWMQNQGRFFPGSALYGLMVWNGLPSRAAYATYLALLGLACIGLFVAVEQLRGFCDIKSSLYHDVDGSVLRCFVQPKRRTTSQCPISISSHQY